MISLNNINKSYGANRIFTDFCLEVETSRTTVIMGPSGCGKTTLIHILAGLTPKDAGTVTGLDSQRVSMVFQEDRLLPWKSAKENILLVLPQEHHTPESEKLVLDLLSSFGLSDYIDDYPSKLSGGMKQRVAIARALACPSDILLMDEPFKALDVKTRKEVIQTFSDIHRQKPRTTLVVTHDPAEALEIADSIVVLNSSPAVITHEFRTSLPSEEKLKEILHL